MFETLDHLRSFMFRFLKKKKKILNVVTLLLWVLFFLDDRHVVLCGDHVGGPHELWGSTASHPPPR